VPADGQAEKTDEVDVSKLTPQERQIYERYGRVPKAKGLQPRAKTRFDSADYFMQKDNNPARRALQRNKRPIVPTE
jgi:cAMP-regulated phosphoprotein/endosulfine conserved region